MEGLLFASGFWVLVLAPKKQAGRAHNEHHYHCLDCGKQFSTLKRETDNEGDEWLDVCPNCHSLNYTINAEDTLS